MDTIRQQRNALRLEVNRCHSELYEVKAHNIESEIVKTEKDNIKCWIEEMEQKTRNVDILIMERNLYKSKYEQVSIFQTDID